MRVHIARDNLVGNGARPRIASESGGGGAVNVAGELIEQNDQRQRACGRLRPIVAFARASGGESRGEAGANGVVVFRPAHKPQPLP